MKSELMHKRISSQSSASICAQKVLNLKCIMVPIDFSACSRKAVQYAVLLARDYNAKIVLAHVSDATVGDGKRLNTFERELNAFARREIGNQARFSTMVKQGEPLREIINIAEAGSVDLLVISTHARAGLPDFCMGSAAEQIVRYAPCPVLVVREHEHDFATSAKPSRDF